MEMLLLSEILLLHAHVKKKKKGWTLFIQRHMDMKYRQAPIYLLIASLNAITRLLALPAKCHNSYFSAPNLKIQRIQRIVIWSLLNAWSHKKRTIVCIYGNINKMNWCLCEMDQMYGLTLPNWSLWTKKLNLATDLVMRCNEIVVFQL